MTLCSVVVKDMLEVGRLKSMEEDRTHFGLWRIVSSPLILGYDMTDNATIDRVWPIITNTEAISVNQACKRTLCRPQSLL